MGSGKKKIEIKKIAKLEARRVAFSKRRVGLFNKARDLEKLCPGTKVTIVLFSCGGKPYAYGDPDSILDGFHTESEKDCSIPKQKSSGFEDNTASSSFLAVASSCPSSWEVAALNGGELGGTTTSSCYAGYTIPSVAAPFEGILRSVEGTILEEIENRDFNNFQILGKNIG